MYFSCISDENRRASFFTFSIKKAIKTSFFSPARLRSRPVETDKNRLFSDHLNIFPWNADIAVPSAKAAPSGPTAYNDGAQLARAGVDFHIADVAQAAAILHTNNLFRP